MALVGIGDLPSCSSNWKAIGPMLCLNDGGV